MRIARDAEARPDARAASMSQAPARKGSSWSTSTKADLPSSTASRSATSSSMSAARRSLPGRCAQCHQGCPQGWQASGVDAVEVGRDDEVRRRSDRSRLSRVKRVPRIANQPGRNARRGQNKQEHRPRRLRGATQTLRKSVTTARSQVRDHSRREPDKLEARGRELEPMTGKMQAKKSWQLAEQHGLWWAYEGDLPPPEAFQTHGRPRHVPILGPYPSRTIAEALLRRYLERRRD